MNDDGQEHQEIIENHKKSQKSMFRAAARHNGCLRGPTGRQGLT